MKNMDHRDPCILNLSFKSKQFCNHRPLAQTLILHLQKPLLFFFSNLKIEGNVNLWGSTCLWFWGGSGRRRLSGTSPAGRADAHSLAELHCQGTRPGLCELSTPSPAAASWGGGCSWLCEAFLFCPWCSFNWNPPEPLIEPLHYTPTQVEQLHKQKLLWPTTVNYKITILYDVGVAMM